MAHRVKSGISAFAFTAAIRFRKPDCGAAITSAQTNATGKIESQEGASRRCSSAGYAEGQNGLGNRN
jgi:hypothetical protein